jgi:glycosyltransferase involved in cell wall biosynthesis
LIDVSVVIPSRDRWTYLRHAVADALAQQDVAHEVIVVLDGGADASADRLGAIADARLRTIALPRARGVAGARNAGIAQAAGEWVAFLDDDDLWGPLKLRRALDAAGDGSFAYGGAAIVDERRRMIVDASPPEPRTLLADLLRRNVMPAGSSNVVMRRSFLQAIGGFDEGLAHLADWDMWIRAAARGHAAATNEIDVAYVHHERNLALRSVREIKRDGRILDERHAELRHRLGVRFDQAGLDRWVATGQRRAGRRVKAAGILMQSAVRTRDVGNAARAIDALVSPRRIRRPRHVPAAPAWLAGAGSGADDSDVVARP